MKKVQSIRILLSNQLSSFLLKNEQKEGLYIRILLWAYEKQETGFTRRELEERFAPTTELRAWISDVFFWGNNNDRPLIKQFTTIENIGYYTLTDKGISSAVDYIELQHAIRGGKIAASIGIVALIVAIGTGWITYQSLQVTQNSLELTAPTVLEIIPDSDKVVSVIDSAERAMGVISASDSTAHLLLVNNSTPTITDVHIRMTLWAIDRVEGDNNFKLCPIGYIGHHNNPYFEVSNFRVDNVLNKKFSLKTGKSYPFTLDYNGIGFTDFWGGPLSEKSSRFVKIDVIYKKKSGHISERYTKILRLFNEETIMDVDLAPEFGSMIATGRIESRENPNGLPSVFYPFQSDRFVEYFKNLPRPDNMSFAECEIFEIDSEKLLLTY